MLIGWSEIDITPKKKIKLAGQFYERISEFTESPICVIAMAVSTEEDHAVFCACDLESIYPNLLALARQKIAQACSGRTAPGPDPAKVMVSATHTHTSYEYKGEDKRDSSLSVLARVLPGSMKYVPKVAAEDVVTSEEALEFLSEKIAEAALTAWDSREEAFYANEFGRAAVGMCRRAVYDDGTAKMWGDTDHANFDCLEGGNDSGIELLYTFDRNKKPTGVVANVACPSQVLEQRSFISSDYWGKVRQYLREEFGPAFHVLGLCSAAGDQCPRDLIRWVEPETPIDDPNVIRIHPLKRRADPSMFDIKGCCRVGRRIADEILAVSREIEEYHTDGIFRHCVLHLRLPLRRVTISEYEAAKRELDEYIKSCGASGEFTFKDNAAMHVCAGVMARYEHQQNTDLHDAEVHVIRLGEIAFATNSFELFLDYGNRIRARSKAQQTFLIQLCCGSDGYLPTEKAERGSHYSAYVSSGVTGHTGGDLLVRSTLETIRTLFEEN